MSEASKSSCIHEGADPRKGLCVPVIESGRELVVVSTTTEGIDTTRCLNMLGFTSAGVNEHT